MDYSQLSDFEINAEVFEALHGGSPDYKEGDNGEMLLVSFEADVVGGDIVEVEVVRGSYNPCHNPADAWPIIVGYDISLNSYGSAWEASFEHDAPIGAYGTDETVTSGYEHRNPLRAAMIAFLMKQEHANA